MNKAEIVCTGSELLLGSSVDTNSLYLSNQLQNMGIEVRFKTIVGDDENEIEEVIQRAIHRTDIVIISGGLGPTVDDLTRNVLAKLCNKKLIFHQDIYSRIKARIKMVHSEKSFPDTVKLQAYVPEGSDYFENKNGTAPGLGILHNGKLIIALPGPPRELKPMWENQVQGWVYDKWSNKQFIISRVLRTTGVPESIVDDKIGELFRNSKNPKIGVCAHPGLVDIHLISSGSSKEDAFAKIVHIEKQLRGILGDCIYGTDNETLESVVGELLIKNGLHLSIAESCSGGLISHRITNISGSSKYFDCGVVTYSNRAKIEMLNVSESIISQYGAVSEKTAIAMAKGIRSISDSDISIAVTGIAGPDGGTPEKPVGLVYIALSDKKETIICNKYNFHGERELIKFRSSQEALDLMRRYLLTLSN